MREREGLMGVQHAAAERHKGEGGIPTRRAGIQLTVFSRIRLLCTACAAVVRPMRLWHNHISLVIIVIRHTDNKLCRRRGTQNLQIDDRHAVHGQRQRHFGI